MALGRWYNYDGVLLSYRSVTASGGDGDGGKAVFDRIDASKLQGALKNASMLTSLEVGVSYNSRCHDMWVCPSCCGCALYSMKVCRPTCCQH